jgi:hypothetical protein
VVVAGIGDDQGATGIDRNPSWQIECGAGGGPAVAAEARGAVAGNGADGARRRHLADDVVAEIGDEDVAAGIDRHPGGDIELGAGGGPAVAAEAGGPVTGEGADGRRQQVARF